MTYLYLSIFAFLFYGTAKFAYHYGKTQAGMTEYLQGWQDCRHHIERSQQIDQSDEWEFTGERLN